MKDIAGSGWMTAIGVVSCFFIFSVVSAEKEISPKVLFEKTCSQCHSLDVPRAEKLTREGWKAIIERMKGNGCDISDAEAKVLIDYLSKEFGK